MKKIIKFLLLAFLLVPKVAFASAKSWDDHLMGLANVILTIIIWIGLILFFSGLIIYINNRSNKKPITGKGMTIGGLLTIIIWFFISYIFDPHWPIIVWLSILYIALTIFVMGIFLYIRNRLKRGLGKGTKIIKIGLIVVIIGIILYMVSPIIIEKIVERFNLGIYSSVDSSDLEDIDFEGVWDN